MRYDVQNWKCLNCQRSGWCLHNRHTHTHTICLNDNFKASNNKPQSSQAPYASEKRIKWKVNNKKNCYLRIFAHTLPFECSNCVVLCTQHLELYIAVSWNPSHSISIPFSRSALLTNPFCWKFIWKTPWKYYTRTRTHRKECKIMPADIFIRIGAQARVWIRQILRKIDKRRTGVPSVNILIKLHGFSRCRSLSLCVCVLFTYAHTVDLASMRESTKEKFFFCRWAVPRKIENWENHRKTIRGRGLRHDKDEIAVCVENIQYIQSRVCYTLWVCTVRERELFFSGVGR